MYRLNVQVTSAYDPLKFLGSSHITETAEPKVVKCCTQGRSVGGAGGAEHPRADGAAPVLRMAHSTPILYPLLALVLLKL